MSALFADEHLSVTLFNAALLALWPALPLLVIGFIKQLLIARRIRPNFSLRRSETAELERAVALYEDVRSRIKEIGKRERPPSRRWPAFLAPSPNATEEEIHELEEFEAHAQHLRESIVRLRNQPLQRLRFWVHVKSAQSAMGLALATHVVTLALLIVAFYDVEQSSWISQFRPPANTLVWYPFDERLFYANAVATGLASLAMPLFYLLRRASLKGEHAFEFAIFKDLATNGPAIGEPQPEAGDDGSSQQVDTGIVGGEPDWAAVLGLSDSATVVEVKDAYKVLIKKNHPDRVHDMSPAFKVLAESETKKINAAYQQALLSAPG
jgi:DnaJ domain